MNILAIDPGDNIGWARSAQMSGTIKCKPKPGESPGMRFLNMTRAINNLICPGEVDLVVFEDVKFHRGRFPTEYYNACSTRIKERCADIGIDWGQCGVSTLKEHATGKGKASKDMMIEAAKRFYPDAEIVDDNHADALCLLHWATEQYGGNQ